MTDSAPSGRNTKHDEPRPAPIRASATPPAPLDVSDLTVEFRKGERG